MFPTPIESCASSEIIKPTWGASKQFLQVHQIVCMDGLPDVLRVDHRSPDCAAVYFQVEGEKFYYAVYVTYDPIPKICGMNSVPFHSVYFRAFSESCSGHELAAMTSLVPTRLSNRGEPKSKNLHPSIVHRVSGLSFEPDPIPERFEDKLNRLLDYLDTDAQGVARLVDAAGGYVQVYSSFHNGNTMLGGHHLTPQLIARLAEHRLGVDFDISADGNFWH